MRMTGPDMYVRIDAIADVGLPGDEMLRAAVLALTEQAVAQALAMIHGKERGYQRYVEAGGVVRFTSYGDAFIPVSTAVRSRPVGRVLRSWNVREDVVKAQLHSGRGSLLGPDTRRRARWWDLTLSCGHVVQRNVQYRRQADGNPDRARRLTEDTKPAPRRVRCGECISILAKTADRARSEAGLS